MTHDSSQAPVKPLALSNFVEDPESKVLYLGNAEPEAAMLQQSEFGRWLLDLQFIVPGRVGDDREDRNRRFVLRLETTGAAVNQLLRWMDYVVQNPTPHPASNDLFEGALIPAELLDKMWGRRLPVRGPDSP